MPILTDLGLSRGRVHSLQQSTRTGLRLPGTSGNYVSTPDSVLNSITGDIDVRMYAKADSWASGAVQVLLAKDNSSGNQRAYQWSISATGSPQVTFSIDGLNTRSESAATPVSFAAGSAGWLRFTLDVDNGAGGSDTKFYTSTDGITWTQIGSTKTTAGVYSLFDSTAVLELGSRNAGVTSLLTGTIYYAEVRNGIDGPIAAKFDASTVTASGGTTPSTINGWTWNGSTLYKRDDYVRLPGTSGNYLSFPDTVANSITGSIEFMAKIQLDDWTPAAINQIVSKGDSGGNRAYRFYVNAAGTLGLALSPDGTTGAGNEINVSSSVAPTIADGAVLYLKATWRQSDGRVQFFTSSDGVTFPQLGTDKSLVIASIFDSTSVLEIGSRAQGVTERLAGNVYYVEVRNGIGGTVANSFSGADNTIQTPWTVNGAAWNWEGASFNGKPGIALSLDGTSGNYASTPDTTGNSITGDIDIRLKVALNDWTVVSQTLLAKEQSAALRSYRVEINSSGQLGIMLSADGTTGTQVGTFTFTPPSAGSAKWVRMAWVQSTHTTTAYLSDDGIAWTSIGSSAAPNIASIFDSTSPVEIGARFLGTTNRLAGKVFYAEVRNGVDGPIVAKFNPTNMAKTGTRTPASTVQPGGSPNMLTPNEASIETSSAGWVVDVNCTILQDLTQFLDGVASLSMTSVAGGTMRVHGFDKKPVVAGKLYVATAFLKAAVSARTCLININWFDAAGGFVSTAIGSGVADATGSWTAVTVTGVAPATATGATLYIQAAATGGASEVHYIDRISLVEAANVWTLNGAAWDLVAA